VKGFTTVSRSRLWRWQSRTVKIVEETIAFIMISNAGVGALPELRWQLVSLLKGSHDLQSARAGQVGWELVTVRLPEARLRLVAQPPVRVPGLASYAKYFSIPKPWAELKSIDAAGNLQCEVKRTVVCWIDKRQPSSYFCCNKAADRARPDAWILHHLPDLTPSFSLRLI
jgi:hypothetical protein